jgi:DNA-binding NarL/FixJ family response regulator
LIEAQQHQQPVRVLVADDHRLFSEALALFLAREPDIDVVGCARDGEEAQRMALRHKPDVVLMDLVMPRSNGIEATRRIAEESPETRVILLTGLEGGAEVDEAIAAGAVACLRKEAALTELAAEIRRVARL